MLVERGDRRGGNCTRVYVLENGLHIKKKLTDIAIAAVTDFVLSVLPILFLWNIKLPKRVKVGICGIMALGFA